MLSLLKKLLAFCTIVLPSLLFAQDHDSARIVALMQGAWADTIQHDNVIILMMTIKGNTILMAASTTDERVEPAPPYTVNFSIDKNACTGAALSDSVMGTGHYLHTFNGPQYVSNTCALIVSVSTTELRLYYIDSSGNKNATRQFIYKRIKSS